MSENDIGAMGGAHCFLRLRVEFGEVTGGQMGRERKNLNSRLDARELGIDHLHERAGGCNGVALKACALLRVRTHDQEGRDHGRRQNAGENQVVQPEANRPARWLYPRGSHDVGDGRVWRRIALSATRTMRSDPQGQNANTSMNAERIEACQLVYKSPDFRAQEAPAFGPELRVFTIGPQTITPSHGAFTGTDLRKSMHVRQILTARDAKVLCPTIRMSPPFLKA